MSMQWERAKRVDESKNLGSKVQEDGGSDREFHKTWVRPTMLFGMKTAPVTKSQEVR